MSTNTALWRRLDAALRNQTLDAPQAFCALGRLVIAENPSRQETYGQKTLRKLGERLREQHPVHFRQQNLTDLLQKAARVAHAFNIPMLNALEKANPEGYRLRVCHLSQLTSIPTAQRRQEWCTRCQKHRWTKRDLQQALFKQHPRASKGGRPLKDPVDGLRSALSALQAVERYFRYHAPTGKRPRKSAVNQQLCALHTECVSQLDHLQLHLQPAGHRKSPAPRKRSKSRQTSRHKL